MEGFYAKINQLLSNVVSKNEAIISEIETVKEKWAEMLDKLSSQNDTIIDEIQLFQQTATKEFKEFCADLVPKVTLGALEQRANTAEQTANQLRSEQTQYLRQIEDLEFEVKNLKSVSLLSQKDKYNRTLQIEIENLERKLKSAEAKYKILEDSVSAKLEDSVSAKLQPSAVTPDNSAAEPNDAVAPDSVVTEQSQSTLPRCYARIGTDKISADTLTVDEIAAYPSDIYKSKTGKFIGRPCTNLVSVDGNVFCAEHSTGFSDIRAEPPRDGEKPKKKKKATSATASLGSAAASNDVVTADSPAVAAEAPTVAAEAPAVAAEAPAVAAEAPAIAAEAPAVTVGIVKEKKTRKKKTTTTEESQAVSNVDTNTQVETTTNEPVNPAPVEEKVKKPRKKKADTEPVTEPTEQAPGSQSSTPGTKRGRKKKETPPTPSRTPIQQKEHTLQKVEGVTKVSKPDWAFIEPWDAPDGTQYVVDTKTNYVFEATETGDIGAFTGFMRT